MAESIRELGIANFENSIKGISRLAGYENDFDKGAVVRNKTNPLNSNIEPCALIYEGKDERIGEEYGENYMIIMDLPLWVEVWASDFEDLPARLDSLKNDIVKAVMGDNDRGGYAIYTEFTGEEKVLAPGDEMGVMILHFNMRYECREDDPTQN